jgi:hypothetical protein
VREAGGLQSLAALLTAEDGPYGQQVAAVSALAVCAKSTASKRILVDLSVLDCAWRLTNSSHELALEATCCVCSVMMDERFVSRCISPGNFIAIFIIGQHHTSNILYNLHALTTAFCRQAQEYALRSLPRLTHRLASLLISGCSNVQHAVAALIANMAVVSLGSARVFAGLGCVDSLVALLAASAPRVQEQAALALSQLLSLDEDLAEEKFDLGGDRAVKGSLTEAAIGLGAIGSLIDMATSGLPSSMRAAGDCCVCGNHREIVVLGGGGCSGGFDKSDTTDRPLPPHVPPRNNSLNQFMSRPHSPPHDPATVHRPFHTDFTNQITL